VLTHRGADIKDRERYQLLYDGRDGRIYENSTVLPRAYAVRNVILEFRDDMFIQRLKNHGDWSATVIVENLPVENDKMRLDLLAPRPPNSPEATSSIILARPSYLRMRVNAPRYTMVATSFAWAGGWRARTSQRSLNPIRINGSFVGFVVPPGTHDVEVDYRPMTFRAGAAISIATIIGICGSAGLALYRSRARSADRAPRAASH
jgi:hypothetical protein